MIYLSRTQIYNKKGSVNEIDITIKSGAKLVAPTWGMVMGWKDGTITDQEYTRMYLNILEKNKEKIIEWLKSLKLDRIVFMCYCRDNTFCHTYLLIDWLVEQDKEFIK